MLTIGLLGGMTCESSIEYYKIINETVRERLGGIHSAQSIMASVDFGIIEPMMEEGQWQDIADILIKQAQNLENGGADFLVICTNTMHKLADTIQREINIPILGIIDATASRIKEKGLTTIGLLGTRFTMEQDFYKHRLIKKHHLKVVIPAPVDMLKINQVIMDELSVGKISQGSKQTYLKIINSLKDMGAEGIILGCTEIPLLIKQEDCLLPLFDTTTIHAVKAVDHALTNTLPPFREKID